MKNQSTEEYKPEDLVVTEIGEDEWPFPEISAILHRRDLQGLEEPYLSAVKKARLKLVH